MWNGAPGSSTASTFASASAKRLDGREAAVGGRVHVREVEHRPHPAEPARDLDDVVERAELAHPAHHLDPERHVAALAPRAAPAARRAARRPSRSPPRASARAGSPGGRRPARRPPPSAIPAEWSSMPTAMFSFLPRSAWPMNPAIGACTESAMSCSRASSPNRSANVVVHPEAALEVDLAGREARARAEPRPPPPGSRATARAPGRNGASAPSTTSLTARRARRRTVADPSDRPLRWDS